MAFLSISNATPVTFILRTPFSYDAQLPRPESVGEGNGATSERRTQCGTCTVALGRWNVRFNSELDPRGTDSHALHSPSLPIPPLSPSCHFSSAWKQCGAWRPSERMLANSHLPSSLQGLPSFSSGKKSFSAASPHSILQHSIAPPLGKVELQDSEIIPSQHSVYSVSPQRCSLHMGVWTKCS